MPLGERSYDITVGVGIITEAKRLFNLDRRTLVLTDSGVPSEYAAAVAECAREAKIMTLPEGERTKSLESLERVLRAMCEFKMDRGDCLVAVGGGVVGDLCGFAAATYMRGIDFYMVPTTLLSQLDSSVGGKTAVNLGGIKNIVGAFHQPRGVIVDVELLKTLPQRQLASGLAEGIKMAVCQSAPLFEFIEGCDNPYSELEKIITEALRIKIDTVARDEREGGVRRLLNFGHTLGHGIEAASLGELLHGECVALGMLPMCSQSIRERLVGIYGKVGLPTEFSGDINAATELISHDKKCSGEQVNAVITDEVGGGRVERLTHLELKERITRVFS